MEEKPHLTEEKKIRLRKKWVESRNFWTFFVSSTFASTVFLWFIWKCRNLDGSFDHVAANNHYSTWGNTIAVFWGVFVANNVLKYVVNRKQGPASGDEAVD